jgi:hypothetical protein
METRPVLSNPNSVTSFTLQIQNFVGDAKTRTVYTTHSTPIAVQPVAFFFVTVSPDVLWAGGLLVWIFMEAPC